MSGRVVLRSVQEKSPVLAAMALVRACADPLGLGLGGKLVVLGRGPPG